MTHYPVPRAVAEVELRFANSRFIGTAGPAASPAAARAFVDAVRRRFAGASHHCYAFAAGCGASVTHGMSDDGEPPGTAGRPMLAVVRGSGLGDVVVVATRYFGGTKLGTGGLVRAYAGTARAALAALETEEKIEAVLLQVELPYDRYELCRQRLQALGASVEEARFAAAVALRVRVDERRLGQVRAALQEATAGRARIEVSRGIWQAASQDAAQCTSPASGASRRSG